MQTTSEDALFQSGIQALQAGKAHEARANFQAAVDADVATPRTWVGLTLACLETRDLPAAEAAVDQALKLDPSNMRGLIIKGDIVHGRGELQAAASHYNLVLRLAAQAPNLPGPLAADIQRVSDRMQEMMNLFYERLLSGLKRAGYQRATASERFNNSLDMLLSRLQRPEDNHRSPQAPHVYYMPDIPYFTYYPTEKLPWMAELEAATDVITGELEQLLAHHNAQFTPYIHSGLEEAQKSKTDLMDSNDWTSAYLWEDSRPNDAVLESCPVTASMMEALPLTRIRGLAPSVLFSKLNPHTRIEPHSGLINTRLICHLPLIVPDGCGLRVGEDRGDMVRGKAWAFDDSINHEAWNNSDETRIILLFDVWRPELDEDERRFVTALLESVTDFREGRRFY